MDNPSGDFSRRYRHISKGGWAFQVADQGWQVSDCTAEALKVLYQNYAKVNRHLEQLDADMSQAEFIFAVLMQSI